MYNVNKAIISQYKYINFICSASSSYALLFEFNFHYFFQTHTQILDKKNGERTL